MAGTCLPHPMPPHPRDNRPAAPPSRSTALRTGENPAIRAPVTIRTTRPSPEVRGILLTCPSLGDYPNKVLHPEAAQTTEVGRMFRNLALVALAGSLLLIGSQTVYPADGNTSPKPRLGFVLVAWDEESHADPRAWENSIRRVYRVGIRDVTVVTYRFVDPATGSLSASSAHGLESPPSDAVVLAALSEGQRLGMRVSVNPLVEIDDPEGIGSEWRGDLSFAGARLDRFFTDYRAYLRNMAELVNSAGAHRLYILLFAGRP